MQRRLNTCEIPKTLAVLSAKNMPTLTDRDELPLYHNLQQTPHNIHFLKGAVSYLLPFFCFYKNFINLAGFL